jgi:hypothetical protein
MKRIFVLFAAVIFPCTVFAQTELPTPPPPPPINPVINSVGDLLGTVFTDEEKRIIRGAIDLVAPGTLPDEQKSPKDGYQDNRDDGYGKSKKKYKEYKKKKKHKGRGKNKGHGKGLPPGLAKRDKLPPGLAKQLERNGRLPPGLQKRALPSKLEAKLPPPQTGTERIIVGNDVVLINAATNVVLDIIQGVLTGNGK